MVKLKLITGDVGTAATPVIKNTKVALAVNTTSNVGSAVSRTSKLGSSDTA